LKMWRTCEEMIHNHLDYAVLRKGKEVIDE